MRDDSSASRLAQTIARDRRRIAEGSRPVYHATWCISSAGPVDVRVTELPLVHLYVPDLVVVAHGARLLIARALEMPPETFDVVVGQAPSDG